MSLPILLLLSYLLLGVFAVAFAIRTVKMARLPVHLRWELSPVPHEKGRGAYGGSYLEEVDWWTKPREKDLAREVTYMAKEILFLKALWEHNRKLWWFSFPFHFGLYLLTGAAGLLLLGSLGASLGILAPLPGALTIGLLVLAGPGYALGTAGAVGLLLTRLASDEMRNSTAPVTYINLLVLLGMLGTGLGAVLTVPDFSRQVVGFVSGLLVASLPEGIPGIVRAHFLCAFVFLAYLPFTQMMHFVAKYFTYHEVRWDDEPVVPGGKLDRELKRLLSQPVTWAAPHIRADGEKTWVDIATDIGTAEEARK